MKQASIILSTYAADVSGVCSALYELGGMTVMDDASGCNSTYNTHDEPRWYSMPSMVYVSALTEMQAVMGHDDILCADIKRTVEELKPAFVAIAGTPIPMMMGTDFRGLAKALEDEIKIPVFGFSTNGMQPYTKGAGAALKAIAKRYCTKSETASERKHADSEKIKVNLLGVTPLDFSITGNLEALKELIENNDMEIISSWAMGSSLEELKKAVEADVNLVVSTTGLQAAEYFEEEFNIPFVTGIPSGNAAAQLFFESVRNAFSSGKTQSAIWKNELSSDCKNENLTVIIGDTVWSASMALSLQKDFGIKNIKVLCPTELPADFMNGCISFVQAEEDFFEIFNNAETIIADPIFKFAATEKNHFIQLAHEACSGRQFRQFIPVVMGKGFNEFYEAHKK